MPVMSETLLDRALNDRSLRALEAIDEAPLDALEHLIAQGPAAGLHPARLRTAKVRRAHMVHVMQPQPFPDKPALMKAIAEAFPARLAALEARRRSNARWPSLDVILAALDAGPRDTVSAGALVQIERRVRLNGTSTWVRMDQSLLFVTDVLMACGNPTLFDDPRVSILPIAEGTPGKLWRGLQGQGLGAVWRRERPSLRARHMRSGRHPDRSEPGPALLGEETRTIIAIA